MIPPAFEYLRPKTIPEAIAFLQQYGDDAKILSGGQSLIPMMKFRLARPGYLIDINRIAGIVVHQGRGRLSEDRRTYARSRSGKLFAHSLEVSHHSRHRARDRRSAGAKHGDAGRQPGAWRSSERSSGHHAGAGGAGGGSRAAGRESAAHRELLRDALHDRACSMTRS